MNHSATSWRAHVCAPEILEARIAPAAVLLNSNTATYDDNDGDHVTVKFSKPVLTAGNVGAVFTFNAAGYLALLDLTASASPDGTGIAFTVAKVAGGDGLVNVGYINATGHDLGAVSVKGDLARIDAGTSTATIAIKSLAARSMGRLGTDTQAAGGNFDSEIKGAVGSLVVSGDVKDVFFNVGGGIGAITIGGSLIGGSATVAGSIQSGGDIGAVKIGRDVQGGTGFNSGFLYSGGKLASVSIGGSLIGGSNTDSGEIQSLHDLGAVKIGHDVQGGSGDSSGSIQSFVGKTTSVSIGGSLLGGSNQNSGEIRSFGNLGAVKIGHDVQGLDDSSALIVSTDKIASVTIGGSLVGGAGASGEIVSTHDLGAVKIGHDVQGGSGAYSGIILCSGKLASVTIGGSLIGGSNTSAGEIFSAGDLGMVKIGHDFTGGSISGAASLDSAGLITSLARIASVTIGGSIIAGLDDSTGSLTKSASILAGDDLGSLTVKGSIVGNFNPNGLSRIEISARGQHTPGANADLAIGKVTVGGRVEFAEILAGYDTSLVAKNADAQIGTVKVSGDWAASNIVAGAKSGLFGYGAGDTILSGAGVKDVATFFSKIASITIAGQVFGLPSSVSASAQFGFVAEEIGALKIGGSAVVLTAGKHTDNFTIGEIIGDAHVHEI